MTIQIPTADLKSALQQTIVTVLGAEKQLGADAQAEIAKLIDDLYPLVQSQTQALLSASNPAVPQTYLAVLQGCVAATIAKLGLKTLETQRQLVASALQTGINVLSLVLRAAVAV